VEDSIVYAEPLYLRSEQGQIPELKRVIVAYGDRLAMEPTLDAAISEVFGGAAPPAAPRVVAPSGGSAVPRPAEIADRVAREHYRAALEGLRSGDWGIFAREMKALGQALESETPEPAPAEPPS
jgi:uncharacterized protein